MKFSVTVLGSSSALPTASRNLTAHLLNAYERFFLIDCGEGTLRQLRRFKINISKINNLFISHLHGDHYFGIFGLLTTFSLLGRSKDFHIFAHEELHELINCQLKQEELSYNIVFHKLNKTENEIIYEDKKITVRSFPLKHRIASNGFLFKEKLGDRNIKKELIPYYNLSVKDIVSIKKGNDFIDNEGNIISNEHLTKKPHKQRSYAFCSDTVFYPPIIDIIKDVDLLYHESTFAEDMKERAKKTLHSTAKDAAEIAKRANAKGLLIGHFSTRYRNLDILQKEAAEVFPNVSLAVDGNTYEIKAWS